MGRFAGRKLYACQSEDLPLENVLRAKRSKADILVPFLVPLPKDTKRGFFMSGNERFLKKSRFVLTFLLFFIFFQPVFLFSASLTRENSETPDANSVSAPPVTTVVSATRREMPLEESTRFVSVITREQIERSGKTYVLDLLRAMPGVSVNQSGPAGRVAEIYMRGTNANMTLVLLDNVQINSPTTGQATQATLEHLTTANIELIEILRGPQSVLYGADALGGVIHIITKPELKGGLHGNAGFEYGTYETFYETGGLSLNEERFAFSGAGSRFDSEGFGDNDESENTTANAHGKVQVTDTSDIDTTFHYYNSITGVEDGAFLQDPNASSRSRGQVVSNKYTIALADWWQHYFQHSFFHTVFKNIDPRNPDTAGADPESKFKLDSNTQTFETQSSFFLGDFDTLIIGYEFEHMWANVKRSQASGGFEKLRRNHGWFGQNELTLWEVWTLVAGIRLDQNEFYGFEASPLFSTAYLIRSLGTKLKASFGKAFKAPTFNELFFPGFGNETLNAEESWGGDIGFDQSYWDQKGTFSAAYFHNTIENLIQFVSVGGVFSAQNVASARTQGVELENRIRLLENLDFYANYTYTNAIDRETDKFLTRRPLHQGKLGLHYDWRKFIFTADWVWVGNREETSGAIRIENDEYMRLDLALFYNLTQYLQLFSRIENASNDHYTETRGFDNPAIRFVTGTKGEF